MTNRIDSVIFDWRIAVTPNVLLEDFHAEDGWAIVEPEPGRIVLERDGVTVIVQAVPYVLRVTVLPPVVEPMVPPVDAVGVAQAEAIKAAHQSPSKTAKRRP